MKARGRIGICLVFVSVLLSLRCLCAAAWAAEPFRIGYCISLSGVYAALGKDLRDGLNLYMEQIGHKAGGRDIEVIVRNVGSSQMSLALDAAYALIDKEKIDVLSGVVDTGPAYAVAKLATEHQIPFVISNAGADDLTQRKASPFIVRVSFCASAGSHPLGEWAYNQGFRKAGPWVPTTVPATSMLAGCAGLSQNWAGKQSKRFGPLWGLRISSPSLPKSIATPMCCWYFLPVVMHGDLLNNMPNPD